ncbi:tRNA (adenosine(37)-N6)-threonylcarbamoyltransferase complex ATPase subunit type 1 TsaE [Rothia kristinae]|uniref:tRNA (adenosine(37)-N6)-threonylcarbamoyltransferase complex ATPase subunit type 1 TsaE n=1 Tax=Rothia kristinae TaxID=37923 RepID=UPI0009E4D487|nr:tRNA (adenosine(37)-N6)-threonylcarbamoyltransferase complex ATPase subunit type 1 TsaE [Rothia kristinae]MDN5640454.1 tRNA (adenosine(37)-N6)-threonylcarbamoyltransferase complex ATPase subunit type 1 TsaE [Actinomycetes bacterium]
MSRPAAPGSGEEEAPARPLTEVALPDLAATRSLARVLAAELRAGDLVVLTGELGAGKTTFTRALGQALGVRGSVISPTFVLARIHPNDPDGPRPGGPDLVHVDAYRLGSVEEVDDLDLEATQDRAVTVVEWGRGLVEHLAESRLELTLERATGEAAPMVEGDEDDEDPRRARLEAFGPRWTGQAGRELARRLEDALRG